MKEDNVLKIKEMCLFSMENIGKYVLQLDNFLSIFVRQYRYLNIYKYSELK